jgi:hypothetical protein
MGWIKVALAMYCSMREEGNSKKANLCYACCMQADMKQNICMGKSSAL